MNKTTLIARNEVLTSLRRKTFVFFAFGLPILLGIVSLGIMLVNRGDDPDQEDFGSGLPAEDIVGYVDPAGLIQALPANVPEERLRSFQDATSARQALDAEEIEGYFLIPKDYVATGELQYIKKTHDPLSSNPSQLIEWILLYNLAGRQESLAISLVQPFELTMISLQPASEEEMGDSWIEALLPTLMTLILYMVIIMTSSILVSAISDEKKNRVLEIVLSSSSTNQFVSGKILAGGILGLMMILVWIGVLWMVISYGGQPLSIPLDFSLSADLLVWVVIFAFLGYAMYGSLMAGVGALSPDIRDARSLTLVVLSPLIIGYMLNSFIQLNPDGPLAIFVSLFPLTAPVTMIIRMTLTEVPIWQLALAATLMVAAAFLIIRGVSQLFRARILLSGQPPSVRRFYQAMLGRI